MLSKGGLRRVPEEWFTACLVFIQITSETDNADKVGFRNSRGLGDITVFVWSLVKGSISKGVIIGSPKVCISICDVVLYL